MSDESSYEIEIVVRGVAVDHETSYGMRTERVTYATLQVPVPPEVAWAIFSEAGAAATSRCASSA